MVLLEPEELDEVAQESTHTIDIESLVPRKDIGLAEHILKTKRGHFDPSKFSDRYENALKALIKAKQAGKPAPAAPERPSNVINLMDALRRSVHSDRGGG